MTARVHLPWLLKAKPLALLVAASLIHASPVVLDRIAVIVGSHVIKTSDIDQDLRITAFLNREPALFTAAAKRQSAERLIDQEIIRQEIISGAYRRPPDSDAVAFEKQIVHDRYGGSDAQLRQALARYALSEETLRAQLLWQITVLRFIDERFHAGVYVSNEDLENYYNQHRADFSKAGESSFEAAQPEIRTLLEGEQVNTNFNQWLAESRKRYPIEYKQEAFG